MKRTTFFLLLSCLCLLSFGREQTTLTTGWQFRFADETSTRPVTLPHDFQMELPWSPEAGGARGFKPMATGCYSRTLRADTAWEGKQVWLNIEGMAVNGEVTVNGQTVGTVAYGYVGAAFDISKALHYGADNDIAITVSTGRKGGSRWYTGGGLIRPVHIVVTEPTAIARHGLYITTPQVSAAEAVVSTQVEVEGMRGKDIAMTVRVQLLAPDGQTTLATAEVPVPRRNNLRRMEVALPDMHLAAPSLWSCDSPILYTAVAELVDGDGRVVDSVSDRFGIRTIEYGKEFGFRLNGQKVFLKGVANHHDLGAVGAAADEEAIARLFRTLKAFGYNHVRCSHNPYSEAFLRLADEYGLLVTDELFDKWQEGGDCWIAEKPFSQFWPSVMQEWMKRDRNHPSVVLWSFGNELQTREDWAGYPTSDWGVTTYRVLREYSRRWDATRPTTVAMFPARRGSIYKNDPRFDIDVFAPELACETDIAAFNYRFRNYAQYLQHDPDLIVYQSEATTSELAAPYFGMDHDHMVGLAYWGAMEYWGESDGWPKKGWNYSFFDEALSPYPQAYLIRSAFEPDEPLVHIGVVDSDRKVDWNDVVVGKIYMSDHWNRAEGSVWNLVTFTNADEVELLVNGKSYGTQQNDRSDIDRRNIIYWTDIPYGKGGKVVAIARTDGKEVARHTLTTAGRATTLKAVVEPSALPDGFVGSDAPLRYVQVRAVDGKGRTATDADAAVTFSLLGDGAEIVAITNADHYTDELFDVNPKQLHGGFAMAIVRLTDPAAQPRLRVTAPGMKSATVKL